MITVQDIPRPVLKLFHDIQKTEPRALLAGGYLRDLDNGKVPKDIDIFVPYDYSHNLDLLLGLDTSLSKDDYEGDDTISAQFLCIIAGIDLPVNVLVCLRDVDPKERLERFDWGICQIAFDGRDLYATHAYMRDKMAKTFTLCRYTNYDQLQNSLNRFERLQSQSYNGWKQVIPEGLIPKAMEDCA
jgi:hypothetical protein